MVKAKKKEKKRPFQTLLSHSFWSSSPKRGASSPPHLAPLGTPLSFPFLLTEHWAVCSSVPAVAGVQLSMTACQHNIGSFRLKCMQGLSAKERALSVQSQSQRQVLWFQEVVLDYSCAKSFLCCPGADRVLEDEPHMSGSPQLPLIVLNQRDFCTKDSKIRIFCVCLCQCDLRAIGPEGGVSKVCGQWLQSWKNLKTSSVPMSKMRRNV